MVVRDENGNPLDPKSTSTMELFRQHQKSSHKLRKFGVGLVQPMLFKLIW